MEPKQLQQCSKNINNWTTSKVLGRLNPELLQHDQKRKALRAVKLIKLKHCGCLAAVKPKTIKLTYAETVRVKTAVEAQNCLISNGGDPTND